MRQRPALPISLKYAAPQITTSAPDLLDMASSNEPKYKKRTLKEIADPVEQAPLKKITNLSSEEEHSTIFEKIINNLIANSKYEPFLVSNPDAIPISLGDIKQNISKGRYFATDLYRDLGLITETARNIYGKKHSISLAAHDLAMKGHAAVRLEDFRIKELEEYVKNNLI